MRRIGIFSGTFDPVHTGHVAFCQAALQACQLDEVVLLPEPVPRGKNRVVPLAHRQKMLELATQNIPQLTVLSLQSKQFTVQETLPELRQQFPADKLTLLVGSDVVRFMYRWPGLGMLLADMDLVIGLRQDDTQTTVGGYMRKIEQLQHIHSRYTCLPSPHAHAASAHVRSGMAHIADINSSVADYIAKHCLYGHTQNYN